MKLKTLHQWKKPEEKEEIFYDSIYTEYPEKANLYTEKKLVVSWHWGYEQVLVTTNQERYFGGILKLDCGDGCTTVLLKSLWYKCKMAEYFMVCSKSQKAV